MLLCHTCSQKLILKLSCTFKYPGRLLDHQLGIGLSITLKAGRGMLRWLWGAVA